MTESKAKAFTDLEKVMLSGREFSYLGLYTKYSDNQDKSRLIDRTIQRFRRNGWISFERKKGTPVWSATELGRTELGKSTDAEPPSRQP